jgi:bifunctional ADP-heptose synthase (sugar kinase/adenylyltransferase)
MTEKDIKEMISQARDLFQITGDIDSVLAVLKDDLMAFNELKSTKNYIENRYD